MYFGFWVINQRQVWTLEAGTVKPASSSTAWGVTVTHSVFCLHWHHFDSLAPFFFSKWGWGTSLLIRNFQKPAHKREMKFAFLYIFSYDRLKAKQLCRACLIPHQGGNLQMLWCPLVARPLRLCQEPNSVGFMWLARPSSGVQKREEKVPAPSCLLLSLYGLLCLFDFKTAIMWKCCKYK